MESRGSAVWEGSLREGSGRLGTESDALRDVPYSFQTRFEEAPGTNPEELIATAHAGCFAMALSMILGEDGLSAERIAATATVALERQGDEFVISRVHLDVRARVPAATPQVFDQAAEKAKAGCPVSKLLNAEITLSAELDG